MPIIDVELVCQSEAQFCAVSASVLADALGTALGTVAGRTWVRKRFLDVDAYAENQVPVVGTDVEHTVAGRRVAVLRDEQHFFRRAILSSYRGRCCMSGLSESKLLIASHIVPWSKDKANRLNPSNGLCLSAIHDRAFDKGLITLTEDFKILVSDIIKRSKDVFIRDVILPLDGKLIEMPEKFSPDVAFITWHRNELFMDNRK